MGLLSWWRARKRAAKAESMMPAPPYYIRWEGKGYVLLGDGTYRTYEGYRLADSIVQTILSGLGPSGPGSSDTSLPASVPLVSGGDGDFLGGGAGGDSSPDIDADQDGGFDGSGPDGL